MDQSYLRDGPALLARHDPYGMVSKWLKLSNQKTPIWKSHKPLSTWLKQPMLLLGGWWDPHLEGILDLHQKSIDVGGNPEIHIGPATHLNWWKEAQDIQLTFFKKHLISGDSSNALKKTKCLWNLTTQKWQQPTEVSNEISGWSLQSNGNACLKPDDGVLEINGPGKGQLFLVSWWVKALLNN